MKENDRNTHERKWKGNGKKMKENERTRKENGKKNEENERK